MTKKLIEYQRSYVLWKEVGVSRGQNVIGQLLLKSMFRFPIGEEKLRFYSTIDWQAESDRAASSSATYRFRQPDPLYPSYYISQNFHGIEGGYLNAIAQDRRFIKVTNYSALVVKA
ncbi:hypothetical protein H6S82_20225 [Planktothrix sp. FACHB-1355]|uniref:Uncharacterized protein n=1 Tax=Aerosakkonema funiforme FACHB-1375 TaxID=2949571 RepID=A0A926VFU7_9CYAN|nr:MULTISPECIES: hypothetical protein [Oscillatoriales]MBD2183191.1 hypothetical protein [Aerosakkonema funiforme FACHB-1375]MBD3561159.1 hypothetical protein [Planktothrix sp. FACHB-1355]